MNSLLSIFSMMLSGISDICLKKSSRLNPIAVNVVRTIGCLFPNLVALFVIKNDFSISTTGLFWTFLSGSMMALAVHFSILALRHGPLGTQLPILRLAFVNTIVLNVIFDGVTLSWQQFTGVGLAISAIYLLVTEKN